MKYLRYSSVLIAILLLPVVLGQDFPLAQDDPVILNAIEFIADHQTPDGGFGQYGEGDLSTTFRACEAIVAAGGDPLSYEVGGVGIDDFFLSVSEGVYNGSYGTNPLAEKINMVMGLVACGLDPRDFGGHDFVADLMSMQNQTTKSFGSGSSDTAYSILALLAAGVSAGDPAIQGAGGYLVDSQLMDGTFEYSTGWGADSNTHSIAVITLSQLGSSGDTWNNAVGAIPSFMNGTNRGLYYQAMWGTSPDVSSTSYGIQAILAASMNPVGSPYAVGGEDPVKYLLSTQNSTTGEFFDPWGSLKPTTLAVTALVGEVTPGINIVEVPLASLMCLGVSIGIRRFGNDR